MLVYILSWPGDENKNSEKRVFSFSSLQTIKAREKNIVSASRAKQTERQNIIKRLLYTHLVSFLIRLPSAFA